MSKYVAVYRNSIGSHWTADLDTVMDFRRLLLGDPEIPWAYLIYATTGRLVEAYSRPKPAVRRRGRGTP